MQAAQHNKLYNIFYYTPYLKIATRHVSLPYRLRFSIYSETSFSSKQRNTTTRTIYSSDRAYPKVPIIISVSSLEKMRAGGRGPGAGAGGRGPGAEER